MVTQYLTFKDQLNLKKISKKKKGRSTNSHEENWFSIMFNLLITFCPLSDSEPNDICAIKISQISRSLFSYKVSGFF